jgi:hypothetical protein
LASQWGEGVAMPPRGIQSGVGAHSTGSMVGRMTNRLKSAHLIFAG